MKYPLLTKWLADACRQHNDDLNYATEPDIADYAASLIEAGGDDIADVLEDVLTGRGEHCACCDWSGTDVPIRSDPLVTLD